MAPYGKEEPDVQALVGKAAWTIGLVVIALVLFFGCWYTINSGYEGVIQTFGKADMAPAYPGFHFKAPLVQSVAKFNMQTQKYGVDATKSSLESAASSDLQMVKVQIAVNYRLAGGKSPEIFTRIGAGYEDTVISPSVHESVKAAISKYNAQELISNREGVRSDIETLLKEKLIPYNIVVEQISIVSFDFSEDYNKAIEAKQVTEQNKLQAQQQLEKVTIEAQQKVAQANADRDSEIARAEGQAKATILIAQADAERARLLQEQLEKSPAYIELQKVNLVQSKWNGVLPVYVYGQGGAVLPIMNMAGFNTGSGGNSTS